MSNIENGLKKTLLSVFFFFGYLTFLLTLIDYDDTLDVQLEAWLIALGKRKELDAWRHSLNA